MDEEDAGERSEQILLSPILWVKAIWNPETQGCTIRPNRSGLAFSRSGEELSMLRHMLFFAFAALAVGLPERRSLAEGPQVQRAVVDGSDIAELTGLDVFKWQFD